MSFEQDQFEPREDRPAVQNCRSEPCEEFELHEDNRWMTGPEGLCAVCAFENLYKAIEESTWGLDEESNLYTMLCAALDEMQRKGPQMMVDLWLAQHKRAETLRVALQMEEAKQSLVALAGVRP
jgi:hypothetical protein